MSKGFKKRRLAIALSACMMAAPSLVQALGMGEIEVNTALNEPLDAKIKLFSATPDELKSLTVEMAPQGAFSRMGIERLPVLRDINFELVGTGAGAPFIKVTSSKAVKEPFLDFILTVNWASGQMMREYTLLLDPPVFEKEQVGRISAATTQPAEVVRAAPATAPSQVRVAPPGSYGPTNRNDTLWGVARDMRPNRSVTVPQMMIGLLKENPEAFANNNINNLRAGHILRQPELEVITELSKQEAAAEANRQYEEWLASKGKAPAVTGRQQRVAAPAPAAESAAKPAPAPAAQAGAPAEARLQLLTPDEEARIRAGTGVGAEGESVESLQRQLAVALETSEASRQENADLRGRVEELEKQLQSVQKLLTLKDETLGALQAEAQQQEQPVMAPEAEAAKQEETAVAPVPAKKPAKPVVQPEPVETSLIDELMENPLYMGAGVGVILLLLVAIIMRRRRQAGEEEEFTPVAVAAEPVAKKAAESDQGGAEKATAVAATAAAASAAAEEEEVSIGDFGNDFGTIQAEESEIDPVAEADVYLAYRRYEQAEALLKEAIAADAGRNELKLKLLEIYHATKDVDSFEAQAESLYAALGGQEDQLWAQAVEMGRELLPDHPLFGEGGAAAEGEAPAGEMEFEETETNEFSFDDEQPLSEESDVISDDELAGSLDFESEGGLEDVTEEAPLDELATEEPAAEAEESTELGAGLEDLGDLDLDLDLGSADELDLGDELADVDSTLDELDLGSEGLEDISSSGEELVDDLADLAEPAEVDEAALDLGEELSDALGEDLDLGEELGELPEAEEAKTPEGLSLADHEEHLDASENQFAEVDLDQFSTGASEEWDVEAAQSVFHSRDVEGETDGLLDSARKKDEESNTIDMDLPMDLDTAEEAVTEEESVESGEQEQASDDAGLPESDAVVEAEQDPLAEIANLGEMDFSQLSDDENDNDDIFSGSDDMVNTKLDLAKAYIDMGDQDGARSILDEIVEEGDDDQRHEAEQLKQQIS